jgi:hypothetical protein
MDWQNNIVKMAILPKAIYILSVIHIKVPMTFITEIEKVYPKVHLETQKTANSQGNTQQKEQCQRYHNTYIKLYYTAIVIKTAWYWHKHRYEDQSNRIADTDINPHSYNHFIFHRGTRNI